MPELRIHSKFPACQKPSQTFFAFKSTKLNGLIQELAGFYFRFMYFPIKRKPAIISPRCKHSLPTLDLFEIISKPPQFAFDGMQPFHVLLLFSCLHDKSC